MILKCSNFSKVSGPDEKHDFEGVFGSKNRPFERAA
jgi:hypothetical protein